MPNRSTEEAVARLWEWAFGNGKEGADERLNTAEGKLGTMHDTLRELEKAENRRAYEERAAKRERRAFTYGIGVVLFVLSVGGIRFALWLTEQITAIQRFLSAGGGP